MDVNAHVNHVLSIMKRRPNEAEKNSNTTLFVFRLEKDNRFYL